MKTAKTLLEYGGDILSSPRWREERKYPHHGTVSCYLHSVRVADRAVRISRWLKRYFGFDSDVRTLVRASLLHDYYLYDWHVADKTHPHRLHGFRHPRVSLENAETEFSLSPREKKLDSDAHVPAYAPLSELPRSVDYLYRRQNLLDRRSLLRSVKKENPLGGRNK